MTTSTILRPLQARDRATSLCAPRFTGGPGLGYAMGTSRIPNPRPERCWGNAELWCARWASTGDVVTLSVMAIRGVVPSASAVWGLLRKRAFRQLRSLVTTSRMSPHDEHGDCQAVIMCDPQIGRWGRHAGGEEPWPSNGCCRRAMVDPSLRSEGSSLYGPGICAIV